MKKVFLILITLFIFVGCANSPNDDSYTLDESKDYFDGLYCYAFSDTEAYCGYMFWKSTEKNKVELRFYGDDSCQAYISTQVLNYKVTDKYAILSSSEADGPKTFIKLNYKTKTFEEAIIFYNNKTFDRLDVFQNMVKYLKY